MPEEKFKLPISSYEELAKIVKAYGHFQEAVSLDEISKFIGIHRTVISGNSGFLLEIEVLQPGAKKVLTAKGRELAHALEHEMPDEISRWWRQIAMECEFISKLVSAVKIRKGMDEVTLQSHIAYSAGQPKKPQFMTGARTVIDVLRAAGLIVEQDGTFGAVETVPEAVSAAGTKTEPPASSNVSTAHSVQLTPVTHAAVSTLAPTVNVNIEVTVTCDVKDLDGLGDKLRRLVSQVTSGDQQDKDSASNKDVE